MMRSAGIVAAMAWALGAASLAAANFWDTKPLKDLVFNGQLEL